MLNKIKNQKLRIKNTNRKCKNIFAFLIYVFSFWFLVFGFSFAMEGFCDTLRLKESEEGSEVEILEEREDSFIIKVPKEEIEVIKKKRPTEIELWREKKILWEDTGDYIAIYLPKEKVILPEEYTGEEYDAAGVLQEEGLKSAGVKGIPSEIASFKGTGKVVGRILKQGQPLKGSRVKIVYVSQQLGALSRLFGPKDISPEELVFEATTDEDGRYGFTNVPIGEYDIYWSAPGTESWYRRLSEKPDITVRPGETVGYQDIEIRPSR